MNPVSWRISLIAAAAIDHPYPYPTGPLERGAPASVLVAWGFHSGTPEDPQLLLTRRTETVETHKGQMAFPGGGRDPEDESVIATALREAREEVGLDPADVEVLGTLPEMGTISNFRVTPVLGLLHRPIEQVALVHNEHEIAESLWVPRSRLLQSYRREAITRGAVRYPIDVFLDEPHRVWGVTGTLLKNLLERLERLG